MPPASWLASTEKFNTSTPAQQATRFELMVVLTIDHAVSPLGTEY
jgi:hypothetical protein